MAMEDAEQPLLSPRLVGEDSHHQEQLLSRPSNTTFTPGIDDIPPINGVRDFFREYLIESKKLWFLAGPAIFTSLCRYSLGAITQVFSGQVGTLALAAVSVENSVIAGFSFGVMLGMGSALETLCGQAFGAGQVDMPNRKHIEGGRNVRNMDVASTVCLRVQLSDGEVLTGAEQDHGDGGDSRSGVGSAHCIKLALDAKAGMGPSGGACDRTWTGFSWKAFQHLWGFVRLSLASAVML
ncbi:hypothetical protein Goklo_016512, partial [Gossypium klotzschianum]|nr:hypothetical protein [Gossypium klotzschianum]